MLISKTLPNEFKSMHHPDSIKLSPICTQALLINLKVFTKPELLKAKGLPTAKIVPLLFKDVENPK